MAWAKILFPRALGWILAALILRSLAFYDSISASGSKTKKTIIQAELFRDLMNFREQIVLHFLQFRVNDEQNRYLRLGQGADFSERRVQDIPSLLLPVGIKEIPVVTPLQKLQAVLGILGARVGISFFKK